MLDLARIEAGQISLEPSRFHLGEMLGSTVALAKLKADEKGLRVEIDLSCEIDRVVEGDPVRIRQVLLNLLSNAVKFTERGNIRLSAVSRADGMVRIEVSDTGIGFEPAMSELVFSRFQQADDSITRRFGGTGLGLNIARQLVDLMGGAIGADSVPGQGSTFWFEIPLCEAAQPRQRETTPSVPDGLTGQVKVLLADDHPTNRLVVEMMLAGLAEITSVENGEEAVGAFDSQEFDVVLMDMQMPVMDGLTAVREIRRREQERNLVQTPVIMLTANALPEHVAASAEAGANLHLEKPITLSTLLGALEEVLPPEEDVEFGDAVS